MLLGKMAKERICEIGSEGLVEGVEGGRAALKKNMYVHTSRNSPTVRLEG